MVWKEGREEGRFFLVACCNKYIHPSRDYGLSRFWWWVGRKYSYHGWGRVERRGLRVHFLDLALWRRLVLILDVWISWILGA